MSFKNASTSRLATPLSIQAACSVSRRSQQVRMLPCPFLEAIRTLKHVPQLCLDGVHCRDGNPAVTVDLARACPMPDLDELKAPKLRYESSLLCAWPLNTCTFSELDRALNVYESPIGWLASRELLLYIAHKVRPRQLTSENSPSYARLRSRALSTAPSRPVVARL